MYFCPGFLTRCGICGKNFSRPLCRIWYKNYYFLSHILSGWLFFLEAIGFSCRIFSVGISHEQEYKLNPEGSSWHWNDTKIIFAYISVDWCIIWTHCAAYSHSLFPQSAQGPHFYQRCIWRTVKENDRVFGLTNLLTECGLCAQVVWLCLNTQPLPHHWYVLLRS